jgi:hypothetical protein
MKTPILTKRLFLDLTGALVCDPPFSVRKKLRAKGERRLSTGSISNMDSLEVKRFVKKVHMTMISGLFLFW